VSVTAPAEIEKASNASRADDITVVISPYRNIYTPTSYSSQQNMLDTLFNLFQSTVTWFPAICRCLMHSKGSAVEKTKEHL
jgi:hypothetical protein